ncbi:MAG: FG-GAP-like repeat-containing protein [Gemmataceae bacterium]
MTHLRRELERLESRDTPATFVWSGAGGNDSWLNDANWVGNAHPTGALAALDDLVFPANAARFTSNNDLTNAAFRSITIASGASYTLSGNGLALGSGSVAGSGNITVNAGATAVLVLNLQFSAPATSDQFFSVAAGSTLTVNGVMSGTGGARLVKSGTGTLVLTADNSPFHGIITLGANAGVLRMQGSPNALGSTAGDTFVGANSQLQIDLPNSTVLEAIHINGNGISNDGALLNVAGNNTLNNTLFLDSNSTIGVGSGKLVQNGLLVAASTFGLTKVGAGTLQLNQTETLNGPTTLAAGTLVVNGNTTNSPITMTGGTLAGTGTVGSITATGGTIRPGLFAAPFSFQSQSVSMNGATYSPTFVNNSSGDVSDLLNVTGTVNLTGATLTLNTTGFTPSRRFSLLLIENDQADPVVGTFNGLAEGATVDVAGVPYRITYRGNTGNDVMLVPQTPVPATDPFAVSGLKNGLAVVYPPAQSGTYQAAAGASFSPFGTIAATVRVATADVNGDQIKDTILVTGPGVPIRVAVVNGVDSTTLIAPFDPFGGNFTGGGFVAAADLDGDNRAEFVVTPDQGGGPRATIFSLPASGTLQTKANFFGIDDESFRGGARPALGDINHDGTPDLLIAAGFGGGPRIALFRGDTLFTTRTKIVGDFFAFPEDAKTLRNGVFAALGDINGDGYADLVFGGGPGGGPRVHILSGQLLTTGSPNLFTQPIANFFVAGNDKDRGGVRLAVTDADDDAKADLVVGSGAGSPARVRVYRGVNFSGTGEPATFQDLTPFGTGTLADGVFVG